MRTWRPAVLALIPLCLLGQAAEPLPSFLAAPVAVDLAPLFAAAEKATPVTPPGVETWTGLPGSSQGSTVYRFNLYRDPLHFSLQGNRVVLHTTVHYWFEVGLRVGSLVKGMGSCGLPPEGFRRALLGIRAEVGLTPDWQLDLKLIPDEPLRMDGCQVTFLGYDITDKVLAGMKDNLAAAAAALQGQLGDAARLRPRAEEAWLQAQQPLELAPDTYLMLNPERLRLSPWTSQGKVLTITPEIQIRPALVLGPRPEPAPRPLPPLDLATTAIAPGFSLRIEADLSYGHAARQLMQQLGGRPFETDKGTFEVVAVAIRGVDGFAFLDLDLKGRVNGRLTLKGRPVFNDELGTLHLEGLDYTLETRSWLAGLGEWFYRSNLRRTLTERCSFFMEKSLQDLRSSIQQGLNRALTPQVALSGELDSLHVGQVEVLGDRFKAVARLEGVMQVRVNPGDR